jgi:hypothetical protein
MPKFLVHKYIQVCRIYEIDAATADTAEELVIKEGKGNFVYEEDQQVIDSFVQEGGIVEEDAACQSS